MKFHYPSKLEMWTIGLCSMVTVLALLSNGPLWSKICYLLMFGTMVMLILTKQDDDDE